jgi:formylglycine-generating enzyme required for sulfatase activity
MLQQVVSFPLPLPDDPRKWDGWSFYNSPNPYERLCLDPQTKPTNELIEEHFRELLLWWQKKLPLKNQPSNPLAQLLRSGLEESSRYLSEARVELLDPGRRQQLDEELAAQATERALNEFRKYVIFVLTDKTLSPEQEQSLLEFGQTHGLTNEAMKELIDSELQNSDAIRISPAPPTPVASSGERQSLDPTKDFMRMLRLSGLDNEAMTDDQRDAFVNMAENLGIDPGEAEDIVDLYLDEIDGTAAPPSPAPKPVTVVAPKKASPANGSAAALSTPQIAAAASMPTVDPAADRAMFPNFISAIGVEMLLVPSGTFQMGSDARDAAPNERPVTQVTLTCYYVSRHLITNAQYEVFDPDHIRKRSPGSGEHHPVVYVSSADAMKFCQWLSSRDKRRYRLPTEAEWEYAARGSDGRRYPWGDQDGRGDLANFADCNTVFAWSARDIDDGFPESSPVGSFPKGVSPFGTEDKAGNVWEWCSDFIGPYNGKPKVNPRGPVSGAQRIYRGGSWKSRFHSLRATTRGSNVPSFSCNDLGFRIVCECA